MYPEQPPSVLQGRQRPEDSIPAYCGCHIHELQIETNVGCQNKRERISLVFMDCHSFMALLVINLMSFSYLPLRMGVIMVDRRLPPLMHR